MPRAEVSLGPGDRGETELALDPCPRARRRRRACGSTRSSRSPADGSMPDGVEVETPSIRPIEPMDTNLNLAIVRLRAEAASRRAERLGPLLADPHARTPPQVEAPVTVRIAAASDGPALVHIADLDSSSVPTAPMLGGERASSRRSRCATQPSSQTRSWRPPTSWRCCGCGHGSSDGVRSGPCAGCPCWPHCRGSATRRVRQDIRARGASRSTRRRGHRLSPRSARAALT